MSEQVFYVIELGIRPGERGSLTELMNEMVAATEADEPGTQSYEWFISDDDATCYIYERYADSAAVMAHLGTFGRRFAKRFWSVLKPIRTTVFGNVSAELREALAGPTTVFLAPARGFVR